MQSLDRRTDNSKKCGEQTAFGRRPDGPEFPSSLWSHRVPTKSIRENQAASGVVHGL